jgi:nucleotide-binding universal stress UspA family protein
VQKDLESSIDKNALATPAHILVATDLTDTEYLLPYVAAQAKNAGAEVTLVNAFPRPEPVVLDPATVAPLNEMKVVRDARVMLLGVARQLEAQGVICHSAVREGWPGRVICEELDQTGATRLIMGTHARSKLGQCLLGSTAEEVLSSVHVPVFVVGPRAHEAVEHATPRKILHPVSLMGNYHESLDLALSLAQADGAELTLLHVLDREVVDEINPERTVDWAKRALEALAAEAVNPVTPVQSLVTMGSLDQEILKAAEQTNADWIIMGAADQQQSWPFNASAHYKVLCRTTRPVLTLRHMPFHAAPMKREEVHFTFPLLIQGAVAGAVHG